MRKLNLIINNLSILVIVLWYINCLTGYSEAGIPPLDPLKIAEIRLLEGGDGPVSINATLRDATIEGFKDIIITSNKYVQLEAFLRIILYLLENN